MCVRVCAFGECVNDTWGDCVLHQIRTVSEIMRRLCIYALCIIILLSRPSVFMIHAYPGHSTESVKRVPCVSLVEFFHKFCPSFSSPFSEQSD